MPSIIRSPTFNKNYTVADNQSVLEDLCPIDQTPLVHNSGYDFSYNKCLACRAQYSDRERGNLEYYKKSAVAYLSNLEINRLLLMEKLSGIEKIIQAAKENKVI